MWNCCRRLLKYPAQPDATVAAPNAYSRPEIPADDPGHQFAQRRVAIGISGARNRNDRSKLRVAEPGKCARNAGEHKAQGHGRPAQCGCLSGEREDTRANHGADAESNQVQRAQRALERVFALFARLQVSIDIGLIRNSLDMYEGTPPQRLLSELNRPAYALLGRRDQKR
jgi:hypothetical protein